MPRWREDVHECGFADMYGDYMYRTSTATNHALPDPPQLVTIQILPAVAAITQDSPSLLVMPPSGS